MNKLSVTEFYNELVNRAKNSKSELRKKYSVDKTAFTDEIIKEMSDILKIKKIIYDYKDNDIKVEKEYYRIDLIAWTQRKEEIKDFIKSKVKSFNPHLWDFDFAIEHENNENDWLDEVIKLAYINCPNRVIISYVDRNKYNDKDYLEIVEKALNLLDPNGHKEFIKNSQDQDEEKYEFGIILGSCHSEYDGDVMSEEYYEKVIDYQLYMIKFDKNKDIKYTYEKIS